MVNAVTHDNAISQGGGNDMCLLVSALLLPAESQILHLPATKVLDDERTANSETVQSSTPAT